MEVIQNGIVVGIFLYVAIIVVMAGILLFLSLASLAGRGKRRRAAEDPASEP
jgi:hypothetical protein